MSIDVKPTAGEVSVTGVNPIAVVLPAGPGAGAPGAAPGSGPTAPPVDLGPIKVMPADRDWATNMPTLAGGPGEGKLAISYAPEVTTLLAHIWLPVKALLPPAADTGHQPLAQPVEADADADLFTALARIWQPDPALAAANSLSLWGSWFSY